MINKDHTNGKQCDALLWNASDGSEWRQSTELDLQYLLYPGVNWAVRLNAKTQAPGVCQQLTPCGTWECPPVICIMGPFL